MTNYPHASFDDLPINIIEAVFNHLSYEDVTRTRIISQYIYEISGKYVKSSINKLRRKIRKAMKKLCNEVNCTNYNTSADTRHYLKIFNVLKAMEESLNMAIVLNRHLIEQDDHCVSMGPILDRYFSMLREIDADNVKIEKLYAMNAHIQRNFFFIIESMESSKLKLKDSVPLGVRTVDLLDLIQNISYNITATYNIKSNNCKLNMKYLLENPKLLTYIPIVPYVMECENRVLTVDEQEALMKYLIMLVNVHNKLEAKTEQYKRELEISRRDFLVFREDCLLDTVLCKLTDMSKARPYIKREILDGPTGKVLEIYKNHNDENFLNYGMMCFINLSCKINEAPLHIKESFKRLKQDIEMEETSVKGIPQNLLNENEPCANAYSFNFRLKVSIPSRTPEIFEINFQDGNI